MYSLVLPSSPKLVVGVRFRLFSSLTDAVDAFTYRNNILTDFSTFSQSIKSSKEVAHQSMILFAR